LFILSCLGYDSFATSVLIFELCRALGLIAVGLGKSGVQPACQHFDKVE
jgi:hypothetical protein